MTLRVGAVLLALLVARAAMLATTVPIGLGRPQVIARGIELFQLADPSLLSPPGPVAVQLLRLDPRRVALRSALANDEVLGLETVADTARRHNAVAAVNAGFFLPSGDPAGLLKVSGDLVSDTRLHRGAVLIDVQAATGTRLTFDRLAVTLRLNIAEGDGTSIVVDAIDAARPANTLVWFSPHFSDHIDTRTAGIDWVLRGSPLTVVERREEAMRTRIPRDGAVLSFGGSIPPPPLDHLAPGTRVRLDAAYMSEFGSEAGTIARAADIVGGAGLLMRQGRRVTDWTPEGLRKGFADERHPRTVVGVAGDGHLWLITVDGRNEKLSLGMNFEELQRLAESLGLRDALNLDGGGSTTMVVRGRIVNHPSDAAGPRKVSDSLLVFAR